MSKFNKPITKTFQHPVKQVEGKDRTLRFIASDETLDRDKETIAVEGWMVEEFQKNPVFLWAHDGYVRPPVGKVTNIVKDTINKQLAAEVYFPTIEELTSEYAASSEHARFIDTVYRMYLGGYLNAVSVGFIGHEGSYDPDGNWRFTSQELLELSGCAVPANPNAIQMAKAKGLSLQDAKQTWVDIKPFKSIKELITRAGRVLSAANEAKLRQSAALIDEVLDSIVNEEELSLQVQDANKGPVINEIDMTKKELISVIKNQFEGGSNG